MTCPSLVGLRTEAAELSYSDQPDALGVAMRERREQQNLVRPPRRNASRRINTDQTSTKYVYITYMPETLTGRLNFRLSPEQEQALRHAAALTGQSLSGFVLSAAVDHAHDLLARANRIELSEAAFRRFVAALDRPDEAAPGWCASPDGRAAFPPLSTPRSAPSSCWTRTGTTRRASPAMLRFSTTGCAESRPSRLPPARPLRGCSVEAGG